MTSILKLHLCYLFIFLSSFAPAIYSEDYGNLDSFFTKDGERVELSCVSANLISLDDEEQMKAIFIDSFWKMYRLCDGFTEKSDLEILNYLSSDFDLIVRPSLHSNTPQTFFAAKINGQLVGYALFESINKDVSYIAELAIAQAYWHQGIGTKLTFAILASDPEIKKIVLVTEILNSISRMFYEHLGFIPSNYTHDGYFSDRYVAYEIAILANS